MMAFQKSVQISKAWIKHYKGKQSFPGCGRSWEPVAQVGTGRLSLKEEANENITEAERVNWKSDSRESVHRP